MTKFRCCWWKTIRTTTKLIRKYVSQIKNSNYDFTWAPSYSMGLEKLTTTKFHLILLDFRLGPHTGLEFLEEADRRQSPAPRRFLLGPG